MSDPDHAPIIAAVQRWQAHPFFQPLTCGVDSGHQNLVPAVMGGEVILTCLDCGYRQSHIPDLVVRFGGQETATAELTDQVGDRRMA